MNQLTETGESGARAATFFGVATMILGLLAIGSPLLAGVSVVVLVGVLLIAGGIVRAIWALRAESFGKGALAFAIGGLSVLCGLALVTDPLLATGLLTFLLVVYFVVDGLLEIFAAFHVKPAKGWGWMLFGGLVSLVLGILIWRQFPLSGAWAIGVLFGVKLLLVGLMMIAMGVGTSSTEGAVEG
ncbi:MAG: HdeD family acid-resistance protein [bacterium]|nr:HdeD family acid-resistance protein [bacterium]